MKNSIYLTLFLFSALCSCNKIKLSGENELIKLIPFKNTENKYGYFNSEGSIVINPQFKIADFFYEGFARVANSEGKYGFIDESGMFAINPQYKNATNFKEGLAVVVPTDGKCQFIDHHGTIVFTLENAEKCGVFNEGLAWIEQDNKFGFINNTGAIIIQPQFDSVQIFSEGLCPILSISGNEKTWGYINAKGEVVINPQFKYALIFEEGLARISDGTNWGYIDHTGKYVINPQFSYASNFKNGSALIRQGDQYGYIDKKGKIIINPQFSAANNFSKNGIAMIKSGDKFGYINKTGKFIINPQFESASAFFENIALAGNADKLGLIDEKGKYLVNPQFDIDYCWYLQDRFYYTNYSFAYSDYFDKSSIINLLTEGSTQNTFRNLTTNSTYSEIKERHTSLGQYTRNSYNYLMVESDIDMGKYATCTQINYQFDNPIVEQVPVTRTVQKYSYYQGGYVNEEVFDHYEEKENPNAKLQLATYFIILKDKAIGRGKDIAKSLIEEFSHKVGGSSVESTYQEDGMQVYEICNSTTFPGCIKVSYSDTKIDMWADFYPNRGE